MKFWLKSQSFQAYISLWHIQIHPHFRVVPFMKTHLQKFILFAAALGMLPLRWSLMQPAGAAAFPREPGEPYAKRRKVRESGLAPS